ncbi:Os05g0437750, partial [Oryza sativa Japonica Group]
LFPLPGPRRRFAVLDHSLLPLHRCAVSWIHQRPLPPPPAAAAASSSSCCTHTLRYIREPHNHIPLHGRCPRVILPSQEILQRHLRPATPTRSAGRGSWSGSR